MVMETLTISKKLASQGDLVLIPRRDYERLVSDSSKETVKRDSRIDRELALALGDVKKGKMYGPFSTAAEGIAFLRSRHRQPQKK